MSFFTDTINQTSSLFKALNPHEATYKSLSTAELLQLRQKSGSHLRREAAKRILMRRGLVYL